MKNRQALGVPACHVELVLFVKELMYCSVANTEKPFKKCTHPSYNWRLVNSKGMPYKAGQGKQYKRWVQIPCGRERCPCDECRKYHARKKAAILDKSFETHSPLHFVVLEADWCEPDALWSCFKRFRRLLKAECPKITYYLQFDSGKTERPHIHLLTRHSEGLTAKAVRRLWVKACESCEVTTYCQFVRNVKNSARYVPKYWYYREGEGKTLKQLTPWLPSKEWNGIKLSQFSRGFLSMSQNALWEAVKRKWFGERIDWDEIETWDEAGCHFVGNIDNSVHRGERELVYYQQNDQKLLWAGDKVTWQQLPAVVSGRNPSTNAYTLRLALTPSQWEGLPTMVRERLFKPVGVPDWRAEVKPSELGLAGKTDDGFNSRLEAVLKMPLDVLQARRLVRQAMKPCLDPSQRLLTPKNRG